MARWTADTVPIVANVKETAAALLEAVRSGMSADAKAKAKNRIDAMAEFNRKVWQTRASHGGGAQRPDSDRLGTRRAGSAAPA